MILYGEMVCGIELWEMGIKGKLWRVIRNIYNVNQSCVYLDGIKTEYFGITQGVAQGCPDFCR